MADNGGAARRTGRRWLWIIAGVAGAGAVAAVIGIWHLPARMYPGTTDGAVQARAALQGGLLTAAAALTAVAGALVALDETRQANTETKRANEAADVRERAANLNTHVRELYVEAAKLLNDPDNLGVRLAGIYALERIAVDSPGDQRTVVEVLSAFVRTRSTDPVPRTPPLAPDIRAAVQVLGRLPRRDDVPRADLDGAELTGTASLEGLNLTAADLHLTAADLHAVHLGEADLTSARLRRGDLSSAQLSGANLASAQLSWADLSSAQLSGANLTSAQLSGANLTDALLRGANLTDALLRGADLTGAHLERADLTDARGLSQGQVDVAHGDADTRLPVTLVRPASWPMPPAS
ncbi:pentapeptide repeat-containing protein [Frankia sp. AgB1.9]|uniref:pentapeptide repeat-containing protein n=1 Tax=unclassified Frankia TaxID=2632575 RepID=UPI00193419FC|nr:MULTISPECIES: pentapeptide repeat-containing protein [unclassified Frankia]MBL7494658.1 pentapeptide repeat-containing protein [Frankia sp. AgW1.1]MBL7553629.1 pentapeptide repeat-containing protein [Frankia sp. AgB1.9]MBL7623594.1 pentapeptide repeat-containing protein [Frankia sp. AgB1.8]